MQKLQLLPTTASAKATSQRWSLARTRRHRMITHMRMKKNPKNIEVPCPDNRLLHIHTGFTPESWERFLGRKPALEEGIFTFPLSKGFREETTVEERLGIDGKRWIPRNTFYALTFDP